MRDKVELTVKLSGKIVLADEEYSALRILGAMSFLELFLLVLILAGLWFWLDSLKAREIGLLAAREACDGEGMQLLDETISGRSLKLARDDHGILRLRRVFTFEYSDTGNNRRSGSVTLLGHDVELMHIHPHLFIVPNPHDQTLH